MKYIVVILLFSSFYFDVSDAQRIRMSYQYIETLSGEAVKRYQTADICFPLCRN